jgi:hypothetical protein
MAMMYGAFALLSSKEKASHRLAVVYLRAEKYYFDLGW